MCPFANWVLYIKNFLSFKLHIKNKMHFVKGESLRGRKIRDKGAVQ